MVAILLAAALVAAGRLDVAVRIGRNPDVGPGRRNGQRFYARQRFAAGDRLAVRRNVRKAFAGAAAPDARLGVADIGERCLPRGFLCRLAAAVLAGSGLRLLQHPNSARRSSSGAAE
jgi:hypothetical protein